MRYDRIERTGKDEIINDKGTIAIHDGDGDADTDDNIETMAIATVMTHIERFCEQVTMHRYEVSHRDTTKPLHSSTLTR